MQQKGFGCSFKDLMRTRESGMAHANSKEKGKKTVLKIPQKSAHWRTREFGGAWDERHEKD